MNRLTLDERRRANDLRRLKATLPASRAIALNRLRHRTDVGWGRHARVGIAITAVVGATLAMLQFAQALALHGPGSLIDWLLPRL
jgi:hypothetical protein